MDKVYLSKNCFSERTVPLPDLKDERIFPGGIKVKALFEADCKWRLVEEFGPDCFREQKDGTLLFQADYTNKENLLTWLLTFRDKVELLEPKAMREELRQSILQMKKNMTIQWKAKEKCEWNQGVVFYVANVTGKRLKNVRAVLILTNLSGEFVR